MATTKKLILEIDTPKGGSKKIEFVNPKNGVTLEQATSFANSLAENNIFDPSTVGRANGLINAYYLETTTTDLT